MTAFVNRGIRGREGFAPCRAARDSRENWLEAEGLLDALIRLDLSKPTRSRSAARTSKMELPVSSRRLYGPTRDQRRPPAISPRKICSSDSLNIRLAPRQGKTDPIGATHPVSLSERSDTAQEVVSRRPLA